MAIRILCMVVMLCVSVTAVSAQEKTGLSVLPSKFFFNYTSFVKPILSCGCLKNETSSGKEKHVLSLDFPVASSWDTINEERIRNKTVHIGSLMPDWSETVGSDKWPLPRISFSTPNFRIKTEGGIMEVSTPSLRTMAQVSVVTERSIWFGLVGVSGFFSQEQFPEFSRGVNFSANFRRNSIGGNGWLGLKFGNFNRNYIATRYGRGHVATEGSTLFNVPGVDGLDWIPLYLEEFETESLSVEGKAKIKLISQSLRIDGAEYKRVIPSPDPLRFGENRFQDLWLTTETEITPFPKVDFLRGVIVLTKDFRNKNRLMFLNDYSAARFFIRLSFD